MEEDERQYGQAMSPRKSSWSDLHAGPFHPLARWSAQQASKIGMTHRERCGGKAFGGLLQRIDVNIPSRQRVRRRICRSTVIAP
jgi:hypothetical protein